MEADKIKESIKRAAQELFRKFGYHKTSVNEIAKKAKIAKATIYKYFDSKEAVLHSLLMDYIRVNVDELVHSNITEMDEEAQQLVRNEPQKYRVLEGLSDGEVLGWSWLIPPYQWHFGASAVDVTDTIALDGRALRGKCDADHDLGGRGE